MNGRRPATRRAEFREARFTNLSAVVFPDPLRPEEHENFATLDFEIQVAQDSTTIGKMVGDVAEFDDGFVSSAHRGPWLRKQRRAALDRTAEGGCLYMVCQFSSVIVRFGRQAGDAQTRVALGADVETD